MPPLSGPAHDDRGAAVVYRDPMYHGSVLGPEARERVNRRRGASPWILAAITLSLVLQGISLVTSSAAAVVNRITFGLIFAAVVYWLVLPPIRRSRWASLWKVRYKEIGRCPACEYDIGSLPRETDGCTVCPECGGAWRLPAQGPATPATHHIPASSLAGQKE